MSTKPGSMEAAFTDACGDQPNVTGGTVEQMDLLRDETGKLPADALRQIRRRGVGRPEGARNKRNRDLAKLICQKYGNPVQFMASVYATPIDQLVETMLLAEGVPEREARLLGLIDEVGAMVRLACEERWGEERLKAVTKALETVERAAGALKSKPGEIALKALGHQITAAREVAGYTDSKKPVEQTVTHKIDGVIFMGAGAPDQDPIAAAQARVREAINSGMIEPDRIQDLRFDPASQSYVVDGDDQDDDQAGFDAGEQP